MDNVKKWRTPVLITFLLLGILISVQFRAQQVFLSDLSLQKTDDLVLILKGLYDKQDKLEKELQDLDRRQREIGNDTTSGAPLVDNLTKEFDRLQIALGLIPAKGPGIVVTIPPDSPAVYLDLVDIVNELWASQAEAISINGQRITSWSTIFWNKQKMTITINGNDVSFPCTIEAIGNPETMEASLRLLGGVLDNLAVYKVYPVVTQSPQLELPAAGPPVFRYLQDAPDTR